MLITSRTAALTMAAAALAFSACGDDDDDTSAGGGATTAAEERPAAPQKVTIRAAGSAKAPSFTVEPAQVKPGAVTVEVTNGLTKAKANGQLVFLTEEKDDREVLAELRKAMTGKPVADWFQAAGGPGETAAGEITRVSQELKTGTYAVVAGADDSVPKLPLARIEVTGSEGPAFEPPAATVTATDYAFEGQAVKAGEPVLLDNQGKQWHHFLAVRMKTGATIADVTKYFKTEKGAPPFAGDANGIDSTVLDGGQSQVVDAPAKPGRYAFFCFVADKQGGPPHVEKGMVSEVEVR